MVGHLLRKEQKEIDMEKPTGCPLQMVQCEECNLYPCKMVPREEQDKRVSKEKRKKIGLATYLAEYLTERGYINGEYYTDKEWIEEITPVLEKGIEDYENVTGRTD